ncbi:MAG: hypothetical protein U1E76_23715 [Planctomycetota bacterium]
MFTRALSIVVGVLLCLPGDDQYSPFEEALREAQRWFSKDDPVQAKAYIDRALERDAKSRLAWSLREQWAEKLGDRDEQVYALHVQVRLALAQKAPAAEQRALRARLDQLDPNAAELLALRTRFIGKLLPIAESYEKEGRPHSAIRIHRQILALDPERSDSENAIQRIASARDPSLAEAAKPKDLFANVSDEWIREFDAKHNTWDTRAKAERDNYLTYTDTGYKVLIRAAEAMEQMNAFYREFFKYGTKEDGKNVSRIDLRIFKDHAEYLKLGSNPPEWSGGIFTGSAVETYVQGGGFESTVGVLFHEAAHQFVGLATSATGWLNEGLASFFEGCRILANGTVIMNLPANHRLFELASRMEKGWMNGPGDGIDGTNVPPKSPTFATVLENRYSWGPAWYAPTWGVVYILYNYQDPVDGRFIYRAAFHEFVNKSGRSGEGAIKNFEEVVLQNPARPTAGVDFSKVTETIKLPRTVQELNEVWKQWIIDLRDEQAGSRKVERPYLTWARHAITRGDYADASEHFEKALVASSTDVELLLEFAEHLAVRRSNPDRASKLALQALQLLEAKQPPDEKAIKAADKKLAEYDPSRKTWADIQRDLVHASRAIVERYLNEHLDMMAMDVSLNLAKDLGAPEMYRYFEEAARRSGKTLALWQLAYNEKNLNGWGSGDATFQPNGVTMKSKLGTFAEDKYDFNFLTLDTVTSGDFSLEAEVLAERGKVFFCGLVFGRKSADSFHALILFPGKNEGGASSTRTGPGPKTLRRGYVHLTSFYGASKFSIWRQDAVDTDRPGWHKMRVDIAGPTVDVWFDDQLVTTQVFSSIDVLRGSFGLITGPGEAEYRNVRYLARTARDPGALIERDLRMKKLAAERAAASPPDKPGSAPPQATPSPSGSFIDQVPPWPRAKWIQGSRASWAEKGFVPTLFVLWSIQQNDQVPIDQWLTHLAQQHADAGLEIVSVAAVDDGPKLASYLQSHPFPGAVGVDLRKNRGYGDTFEMYRIPQFNLPRLLLLDLDGKVFWEGDPGFAAGTSWKEGDDSILTTPLEDLLARRKVRELVTWRKDWSEQGLKLLLCGELRSALPLLKAANALDPIDPLVADAQQKWTELNASLNALDTVAAALAAANAEPALETLVQWAEVIGAPVPAKMRGLLKPFLEGKNLKSWHQARDLVKATRAAWKAGKEELACTQLLDKLGKQPGEFPAQLGASLEAAIQSQDWDRAARALAEADQLPARWLVTQHFHW